MSDALSERYKKALVTVAMGFRTEDDIKKSGLYRFRKNEKENLLEYVNLLFKRNRNILALKVKHTGYRSEHINITSEEELNKFEKNIDNLFGKDNEIWIVSSSAEQCWRCRIYLSGSSENDEIEMAYSFDDHILDHINSNTDIPYIYYKLENKDFHVVKTNVSDEKIQETLLAIKDIFSKYYGIFKNIKQDLNVLGLNGISLDVRINDGYDFHDFDVAYPDIPKVINYYLPQIRL